MDDDLQIDHVHSLIKEMGFVSFCVGIYCSLVSWCSGHLFSLKDKIKQSRPGRLRWAIARTRLHAHLRLARRAAVLITHIHVSSNTNCRPWTSIHYMSLLAVKQKYWWEVNLLYFDLKLQFRTFLSLRILNKSREKQMKHSEKQFCLIF